MDSSEVNSGLNFQFRTTRKWKIKGRRMIIVRHYLFWYSWELFYCCSECACVRSVTGSSISTHSSCTFHLFLSTHSDIFACTTAGLKCQSYLVNAQPRCRDARPASEERVGCSCKCLSRYRFFWSTHKLSPFLIPAVHDNPSCVPNGGLNKGSEQVFYDTRIL